MLQEIINSSIRTIFAFFLALLLTRFMGRKAVSQMTFFDFVVAILGSVTATISISSPTSVYSPTTALIVLALLTVLVDFIHIKSIWFSKLVESEPVVLIANGLIINQNMKRVRVSVQNLTTLLREKNIFNITDVEFAILENDGKLSVLPKSQKQPATPSDFNIATPYKGLMKDIIIDGKLLLHNLIDASQDKQWLITQLNSQGIASIEEVFYAGLDTLGSLYASIKNYDNEKPGKYGIE